MATVRADKHAEDALAVTPGREPLLPGARFVDFELADHSGNERRLSELVGGDPAVLQF